MEIFVLRIVSGSLIVGGIASDDAKDGHFMLHNPFFLVPSGPEGHLAYIPFMALGAGDSCPMRWEHVLTHYPLEESERSSYQRAVDGFRARRAGIIPMEKAGIAPVKGGGLKAVKN